jgi:hypothetical protein
MEWSWPEYPFRDDITEPSAEVEELRADLGASGAFHIKITDMRGCIPEPRGALMARLTATAYFYKFGEA